VSQSLAALLGAIAGALLTGLAGLYAAREKRRNQARAASMLLVDAMIDIAETMQVAINAEVWWQAGLPLDAWTTQQTALAKGGIPGRHFHSLAGVFSMAGRLERRRLDGQPFDLELTKAVRDRFEMASDFALEQGMRYRERLVIRVLTVAIRIRVPGAYATLERYLGATTIEWPLPTAQPNASRAGGP
jgi:hypothetical protein